MIEPRADAKTIAAAGPAPEYRPVGDELDLAVDCWRAGLPLLLKGPTGCGKTRLVETVADRLGLQLVTVSCHDDMLAADLVGRYVLEGGDTVWHDGPLTRAVRQGGICYLDEIVEARADAIVAIHSLTDHRRQLFVDRRDEIVDAPAGFMLIASYNPGYQSVLKDLKPSTRQRFVAVDLTFPGLDAEIEIVRTESGADRDVVESLVRLGQAARRISDAEVAEVVSTRALVHAARLTVQGVAPARAARAAVAAVLTDDLELAETLGELVDSYVA